MPIRFQYYVLLFIPFFALFYSESLQIGGMTISQLWKIPLAFYLIYYLLQHRHFKSPRWSEWQYVGSLKSLFNADAIVNPASNVQTALKMAFLPLLYNYIHNHEWQAETLRKVLLVVAHYFILTNVPVFLGLKTFKTGHDYGTFVAYSGIFQNQHAMSIIMAMCIVIILNAFKTGQLKGMVARVYNMGLIVLACYAMYLGFARTGWLMFLLGTVTLFWPRNMSVKQWIGILLIGFTLMAGFVYLFNTNELFHDRIVGNNIQTHQKMNVDSGRSEYMAIALDRYAHGTVPEYVFGVSYTEVRAAIQAKTKLHIGAHNGFVDALTANGLLGLALLLLFAFSLFAFILRRRNNETFRLALAMWMMFWSFQTTQGGYMFHTDFIYALIFCLLEREHEDSEHEECVQTTK